MPPTDASHSSPLLFAPAQSRPFAERVAAALGVSLAPSEEREFDGGEHRMRALIDVRGHDVFVVQSLGGDERASANDRLCRLLFLIGALRDAGAASLTACLPYLCYARKDRRTHAYDPVITRYVAALFEAVGTDRLLALDVHNEAAFDNSFRCEAIRLSAAGVFAEAIAALAGANAVTIASPDIGGVKRAQLWREMLSEQLGRELGFAFMEKRRVGGVVSGEALIGDVRDRDVLIADDLIASGGTVVRATRAARGAGAAHVYVAATHAVFAPAALQLFEVGGPDAVLISDSVELPKAFQSLAGGRLQVCSAAPLFARAIADLAH